MATRHHLLQKLPIDLKRLPLTDWKEIFDYLNIDPAIRDRVFRAVYHENTADLETIPEIPETDRNKLLEVATITRSDVHELVRSEDGSWKLTLRLHDGGLTEAVIIPEWSGGTLRKCSASISSQIGCFFGCSFCATGQMGFHRNLATGELVDQVREVEKAVRAKLDTGLTHLYFMGMGEPMNNYRAVSDALTIMRDPEAPGPAPSRITVSTVGLFRQIRMLALDHPEVRLAVSIHSADQTTREQIMPVSAKLDLPSIREAMEFHHRRTGHAVTIQYLLMDGVNDRPDDARKLAGYLGALPAVVTLIMLNPVSASDYRRPEVQKMQAFRMILDTSGIPTDVRYCYGEDIEAGCGQLKIAADQKRVSMSMRHRHNMVPDHG